MITWTYQIMEMLYADSLGGQDDVVTEVIFRVTGTADDGYSASVDTTCPVELDPDVAFIPYADLTEADVVAWVSDPSFIVSIQEQLESQIEFERNPLNVDTTFPWNSGE